MAGLPLVLLLGCPESGLDKFEEDGGAYEEDGGAADGDTLVMEECPSLCLAAQSDLAPLGCDVQCDVDLGTSFVGDVSVTVFPLLTVGAAGDFQTGASCDVVVACDDMDTCRYFAMGCMTDSSNEVEHCVDEYLQCSLEETCLGQFMECNDVAYSAAYACEDAGEPDCSALLDEYLAVCNCAYDDCVGSMSEHCEDGEATPPVPLPLKTGPTQWKVSRAFIQRQLDRGAALRTETFLAVMPNAAGVPTGLSLRSIVPGDALHQLGLRDGDILLTVGGQAIVDLIAAPAGLLDLVDAPKVKITLRRGGAARQHEYTFVP
ncbi:MAG: serine protease [Deltaproteobacteria bacterium]|nr:serine protease [Nannocystaceae bacterium]